MDVVQTGNVSIIFLNIVPVNRSIMHELVCIVLLNHTKFEQD